MTCNWADDLMDAVVWLEDVGKEDLSIVGGKGASLGEMISIGVPVPGGFAVTAQAFRDFINRAGIADRLFEALNVDVNQETELHRAEQTAKKLIMEAKAPKDIKDAIKSLYEHLCKIKGREAYVVVRSSATAEDLPDTSFSRQQETFLNMRGSEDIFNAVRKCWASLYGARAIIRAVLPMSQP